ncbi:MAG: lactate utilization protein, partial [Treponema sp.]|nr:lactate utilization protein [Treponema sp.]
DAATRARQVAAPTNAQRFPALKTPCNEIGTCMDCASPDTVCNVFTTIRYCNPPGRIKVILVGKALGF